MPGPLRQLVAWLTVTIGTDGVGVSVTVAAPAGSTALAGVSVLPGAFCAWMVAASAVMVAAAGLPCADGALQARAARINKAGTKSSCFLFMMISSSSNGWY